MSRRQRKTSQEASATLEAFGFPQNAVFLGYVIHRSQSNLFLETVTVDRETYRIHYVWVERPEHAVRYLDVSVASAFVKHYCKDSVTALLFVHEDSYIVRWSSQ